ncbi:MAG: DUF6526 family protein [Ignavibacteriae bacterium]|nr:DUF6526 family protein [Ignavibacteriota bacterium]
MSQQNYSNHKRYVLMYHAVIFPIILILFISSIYYTIDEAIKGVSIKPGLFLLLISFVLLNLFAFARIFSLKAQDRAIRAEENFRHYLLTAKPLDSKLTIRQIIGLRFASDEEFPELARKAAESGMSEDDIKKAVKNWRADIYRV